MIAEDLRPDTPYYLIVMSPNGEGEKALEYVIEQTRLTGWRVAILHMISDAQKMLMPWGGVSAAIERGEIDEAEDYLNYIKAKLKKKGISADVLIRNGHHEDELLKLLSTHQNIKSLVLEGDTNAGSPGPLVERFSGTGLSDLNVPLTIVPVHVDIDCS